MMRVPGFVALQVNGFLGVDFSAADLEEDRFVQACRALLQRGTAGFLPTVITSSEEVYRRNLPLMADVVQRKEFEGRLLGIHLEGPFLSAEPGAIGAHNPTWVRPPDPDFLDRLLGWADGTVRLITVAACKEGASELTRHAVAKGVAVSLGHQMATEADFARLADAGATTLTHLGNGLPNMVHRHHNPIWAGLAEDRLSVTIITDGHHLPPSLIKTIVRAKGVDKVIVVSDASPIAGLLPGRYTTLGNEVVLEESGLLHNVEKGCMVGSSATMLVCMNHLASLGVLSPQELLAMGYLNPLILLGLGPQDVRPAENIVYDPGKKRFELTTDHGAVRAAS